MDLFPIVDHRDHARALKAVETLWDARDGTSDAATLDAFATLIDAYERKRWPIDGKLDPVDHLTYAIRNLGRSQGDLAALIGGSRASEVLRRKRPLTLDMIHKIGEAWGIPVALLAKPYPIDRPTRHGGSAIGGGRQPKAAGG